MEKKIYGMGIEIQKDAVGVLSHEISAFQERIFKILIINDSISQADYEGTYKIFEIEKNNDPAGGTAYEIKKILKE